MEDQQISTIETDNSEGGKKNLWLVFLLILVFINLLVLNYFEFFKTNISTNDERLELLEKQAWTLTQRVADLHNQTATPGAQIDIEKELGSLPVLLPTSFPTAMPTTEAGPEVSVTPTPILKVKEHYIPLGTASIQTDDYTFRDTAAEAVVDLANYPGIRQVVFEASLSVPSGQVQARLYNATDGYAIGGSEITGDGYSPVLYRSGNISLAGGVKTYRVQMRTSLSSPGKMDMGRLRILLD